MSRTKPFSTLPVSAEEHFRLLLMGLLLDLFDQEDAQGKLSEFIGHFPFLQSYTGRIASLWHAEQRPTAKQWSAAVGTWAEGQTMPLDRLGQVAPGRTVLPAILMIAAIEEDPRFALLIEPNGGAPTLGGMTVFLSDICPAETTGAIREQVFHLAELGVLTISNREAPRIEWNLRVADAPFELLTGAAPRLDDMQLIPHRALPKPSGWIAPDDQAIGPRALAETMAHGAGATVLMRGDRHNGRKTMMRMAAQHAGWGVLQIMPSVIADAEAWKLANLLAALADALIVAEFDPAPGERAAIPPSRLAAPRLAIITGQSASIDHGRSAFPTIPVHLPRPAPKARKAHWKRAGITKGGARLADHLLTSGHIHHAARSAALAEDETPLDAIRATLADMRDPRLEATAQRVILDSDLDALFLDQEEREELDGLALRCRLREQLHGTSEAGVKALLTGPSGTGKTLAAKHLARELGRPLYRIDLAATVNKYIGETEKNLEQALAAAEELDIVLLLDEGDALLAKRTDVGSSTDRYANMETNFLLQRLEVFRGIILVTTNDGDRIDRAFQRRMDAVIPFRLPDQLRRLDILRSQLGTHGVSDELLDEIACRCSLTGGQLHNVALHARLLALAGKCRLGNAQLVKAIQREFRKSGDPCPLRPALAEVG